MERFLYLVLVAMCFWSLWRQKQGLPLRAHLMTCHYPTQRLWSWEHRYSVHQTLSRLALPIGPRDSSLCAQNKQAQPLQKVPQGVLDLPPSPGTPRPTPPPPYYWPQWGSCEASCLLHSFPECLGSVRKLTVLFVWGAFCHVMNNSCN